MTLDEAIAILSDMKIDIPVPKAAVTQKKRNVALDMAISALSCSEIPNSSDTISRQAALDIYDDYNVAVENGELEAYGKHRKRLLELSSAQPEPAVPLQWIEAQIEWLKSLDNAFSTLTAGQISAMVNKWRDEQDE